VPPKPKTQSKSKSAKAKPSKPTATAESKSAKTFAPLAKQAGRPPLPQDYTKASLTLRLRDILWLDRLCADIREQTGAILDRGGLLRGLIAAVQDSGIDLRGCSTEEQISESIASKLRISRSS